MRNSISKNGAFIFFLMIALTSFFSCDNNSPNFGDEVVISRTCLGAKSESAAKELGRYLSGQDQIGVLELMYEGKVRSFEPGTRAKYTAHRGGYKIIRSYDDFGEWYLVTGDIEKPKNNY